MKVLRNLTNLFAMIAFTMAFYQVAPHTTRDAFTNGCICWCVGLVLFIVWVFMPEESQEPR